MTASETVPAERANPPVVALRFEPGALWALDQTALPWRERELELRSAADVVDAIKRLAIRGAPLIGVAAAYGVALEVAADPARATLERACAELKASRPTAVNLAWAVDRVHTATAGLADGAGLAESVLAEACAIHADELAASDALAAHGADLLSAAVAHRPMRLMTHCNTGALAAPGRGTALAVIAELSTRGLLERVLATESRPLLQGARLTVYELGKLGIEHELLVDSAAAGLIAGGAVDGVIVGCDRVAANGDVANKVGTYGLALAAHAAGIPFVVAGPTSTIDLHCPAGTAIAIEERSGEEVIHAATASGPQPLAVAGTSCRNPAFDVTPASLVTALVTECGPLRSPYPESIAELSSARPRRALPSGSAR
jgi:methylthioribose-1-phosphate isomerase